MRIGLALGVGAVALLAAAIAIGFFGAALFLELVSRQLNASAAAAISGAAGLVLAILLGLIARRCLRCARAPAGSRSRSTIDDAAADLGALLARQLAAATQEHPYTTLGASLAAGFAVGALPELRKALAGLLKQ